MDLWPEDVVPGRLTWSVTRDKRLRACLRRYYLHHFASRGGGGQKSTRESRELYLLKHLRNRFMWVGETVHEMVELALNAFRRGDEVPVDQLIDRGTRRMRAQYSESVQGIYRDSPNTKFALFEHEYREDITRDEWKLQRDRMAACLRTFFALPVVQTIRKAPVLQWLAVESAASFELDGATVIVKPDFAWRDTEGRVVLVDWKTGKPRQDDERLQLAVYAAYAKRAWGVAPDFTRALVAYLETGDVIELEFTDTDLVWGESMIRDSVKTMRELGAYDTDAARFPLTDDLKQCGFCSFKRVCGRNGQR
ncbi:MAG: PD-(D/E)XK nuclease family protein [Clostridia bacterium]|nr:PD-(D/E)XK nuclease family protein [Deltaproteobacteria bacterium]